MRRATLFLIAVGLISMVLASASHARQGATAAAGAARQADPWLVKAVLGYLATSGNTNSSSLNSGFSVTYESGDWLHLLEATAINSSEEEQTTAEAYGVGWKSEYSVTQSDFLFGRVN